MKPWPLPSSIAQEQPSVEHQVTDAGYSISQYVRVEH